LMNSFWLLKCTSKPRSPLMCVCVVKYIWAWLASQTHMCMGTFRHQIVGSGHTLWYSMGHRLFMRSEPVLCYWRLFIIIIIINCKWVFTRWQWYNNKTTDK
jgi:hypothetical protein